MPIIFLQQYCCTQAVKSSGQLKIHSYYNQALHGFSYSNITTSSMQECLQHCLSDCLCQTFQICGNTCQLCSNLTGSNAGQLNSTAIRENIGCNRFEFEHRNNLWVSYLTSISVLWDDLMTLYHYFVHSLILVLQLSNIFHVYIVISIRVEIGKVRNFVGACCLFRLSFIPLVILCSPFQDERLMSSMNFIRRSNEMTGC